MRSPALVLALASLVLLASCGFVLTDDQRGRRLFDAERYGEAASTFRDPFWKAVSHFRAGEFEEAAGIFAGFDTAEGTYDHGNSLAMLGRYEAAIPRYERALALRPGWEDAEKNLEIARVSAARLAKKGGDMTGGEMGADEIEISEGVKKDPSAGTGETEGGAPMSDEEIRAIWLRRVRTKPADFLRSKFAYQAAREER